MTRVLWLAAFAFGLGIALPTFAQSPGNFSTLSTTGTSTLAGDVLMCSGHPWIDVRCNGAVGDDSHDDTTAINTTISGGGTLAVSSGGLADPTVKRFVAGREVRKVVYVPDKLLNLVI